MSKRKIWNVNEKKHYKMYKNGKQWFFAGMGIVAGLFGAGSTTIASADETPRGRTLISVNRRTSSQPRPVRRFRVRRVLQTRKVLIQRTIV